MKKLVLSLFLVSISSAVAQKHSHSEKAHSHGVAQVSIAFEGLKGKLEFESPAESTVGFEHPAKSSADKKKVAETLDLIRTQISEMVIFNADLKCQFLPVHVELETEGLNHSETHGEFDIQCEKSPKGTALHFDFTKTFPKLKKVDVQVLVDDVQKSLSVKKGPASLEIK